MDDLAGLPDFQACLSSGGLLMFAPFRSGSFSVLPEKLDVATDAAGLPKFQLSLLKHSNDPNGMNPYAALDIALNADFPLDEAISGARNQDESATAKPVDINTGFARLYPTGSAVALPADMLAPVALDWSGSDFVRWRMRLSLDTGELIKGALLNSTLLFGACVEFSVIGVIPRIGVSVQFRPAELMATLLANSQNCELSNREITAFFAQSSNTLPVRVIGSLGAADVGLFPQVMADRVVASFGSARPAPEPGDPSIILLPHPDELAIATVTWDLSEPATAPRHFVMMLDPLTSLQASSNGRGFDGLVKEMTIPPLDLGFRSVDIAANLPASRVGVLAMGVNLQVAPNPPLRPAGVSETALFTPPQDDAVVDLRLSPDESLLYTLSTFVVVAAGGGVQEYSSPAREFDQPWVRLQASDFPVSFAHLTALDRLLNLATISGMLSYTVNSRTVEQPFVLNSEISDVALAVPTIATNALISLTAAPKDGGSVLSLSPFTPARYRLDVTSFREYGPHIVTIECAFATDEGFLAIDLLPEEKGRDESASSTFTCTAAQPWGTWGYTTSSPFKSGYRYRKSAMAGAEAEAWSEVLSPFTPLFLKEDGTMDAGGNITSFDIDGTHFYAQTVRPDTLYYIPGEPVPEVDSQGRPMLTLLQTTSISTLQLGVQFTLDLASQKAALEQIAVEQSAFAGARLQPAFVRVLKVTVLLADNTGNLTELKSAASSSFPPYTTVFSISLNPEQAAQVAAAINGRSGLLFVEYSIAVPAEAATAKAAPGQQAHRADIANWFPGTEGAAHLRLAG